MEPYERSELGGVGEGLSSIDRAQPLTQLRVSRKAANSAQPSPIGEGDITYLISPSSTKGLLSLVPQYRALGSLSPGEITT